MTNEYFCFNRFILTKRMFLTIISGDLEVVDNLPELFDLPELIRTKQDPCLF